MHVPPSDLPDLFGSIDVYLFDQLLKGRLQPGMRVLDAGCGAGRNLPYFMRHGFEVSAADADPRAVAAVRALAARLAPALPPGNFRAERLEALTFDDASFDVVIASAVLHFAEDDAHFDAMVRACFRVLRPGGMFFARLASSIGLEGAVPLGNGRFRLPDGSDRYLVDAERLEGLESELGATPLEPLKTSNVAGLRCMTTWVVSKG